MRLVADSHPARHLHIVVRPVVVWPFVVVGLVVVVFLAVVCPVVVVLPLLLLCPKMCGKYA